MHTTKLDGLIWVQENEPSPSMYTMGSPSPRSFRRPKKIAGIAYSNDPVAFQCPGQEYTLVIGDEELIFWGLEEADEPFSLSEYIPYLDTPDCWGRSIGTTDTKYQLCFRARANDEYNAYIDKRMEELNLKQG